MNQIHYFNPGHENAVLNRLPSYTAPASQTTLMRELASLPAWYAYREDIVLVGDKYDRSYHDSLVDIGIDLPKLLLSKELKEYDKASIFMWGITPHAIRVFQSFNRNYSLSLNIPDWDEKYIYLNSREVARDVLKEIKTISSSYDSISLPIFSSDIESIKSLVDSQSRSLLAKSPYSSSGRGLLWLPADGLTRTELQILQGMLKKQGSVSIEPAYDKKIDFAMEFMSDGEGGISFAGYSLFTTNEKGAYQGNILCSQAIIAETLTKYIDITILNDTKSILLNLISKCYGSIYKGCIGVDMMVVLENESYALHPCVEINMRYNMGFLSIKLFENYIHDLSNGQYFVDADTRWELYGEHLKMQKDFPLIVENGKVKSGYLSLCPIDQNTKYRAYIIIENLN